MISTACGSMSTPKRLFLSIFAFRMTERRGSPSWSLITSGNSACSRFLRMLGEVAHVIVNQTLEGTDEK